MDELVAVVVQDPDLERLLVQERDRAACRSLLGARRGRSRSRRSDRTSPARVPPAGRSRSAPARPGRPGRRWRAARAPDDRTRAGSPRPPTPARRRARRRTAAPRASRRRVAGIVSCPRAESSCRVERDKRVRALVCVHPDHDHLHRPFVGCGRRSGSPADTPQLGRCHAPIKSRRRSSDGDGRHGKSRSDPTGRQAKRESARRRPRAKPTSRTTPTAGPSGSH